MMDLVKLLQIVELKGFLVNNLFQIHTTAWRCNLRSPSGECAAFGDGVTPGIAVDRALQIAERTDPAKSSNYAVKRSRADDLLE